jgi:hypothetical protein
MSDDEDNISDDFDEKEEGGDFDEKEENVWEQPSVEMRPGINAFQQVSFDNFNISNVPQNRFERALLDPLARFRLYVDAISRSLNDTDTIITDTSIQYIIEHAQFLENVKYKNPTAYILGYIATNGGKQALTNEMFDYITKTVLPRVSNNFVYLSKRSIMRRMDNKGLYVKDGRLINDRPNSMTGIQKAANMKRIIDEDRKIKMIADGIERAESNKMMNDFFG